MDLNTYSSTTEATHPEDALGCDPLGSPKLSSKSFLLHLGFFILKP